MSRNTIYFFTFENDIAAVRREKPGYYTKCRRFTAARGSEQSDEFAVVYLETHIF